MKTIKQNKIPEIIQSVSKELKEKEIDASRIDIYVDFLCDLSEKECFYLINNRSTTLYESDMEFLIVTMSDCLKPYEDLEEYEFCQRILNSVNKYKTYLIKR